MQGGGAVKLLQATKNKKETAAELPARKGKMRELGGGEESKKGDIGKLGLKLSRRSFCSIGKQ